MRNSTLYIQSNFNGEFQSLRAIDADTRTPISCSHRIECKIRHHHAHIIRISEKSQPFADSITYTSIGHPKPITPSTRSYVLFPYASNEALSPPKSSGRRSLETTHVGCARTWAGLISCSFPILVSGPLHHHAALTDCFRNARSVALL